MIDMENAIFEFKTEGRPISCERYGFGHINITYLAVTDIGHRYILQRINKRVFPDVAGLMENITAVTRFIGERSDDSRKAMTVIPTNDGRSYFTDDEGEHWRVYDFIEDGICLQSAETPDDFYESAVAFGGFQQVMAEFPAKTLHETIPDFHNTIDRLVKFHKALEADVLDRAKNVRKEIEFILERGREAGRLHRLRESGGLPLRVTHNDTKLNNVILDAKTRKALCVIDLDTVMPGLSLYDFGDSIRFGAATAAEDEQDLEKMEMSLELFAAYTKGFVGVCPSLLPTELELLPLGAKTMTLECGIRFLTDYLEGDRYFAIHREGHNLDRARTQLKLVADMEIKWNHMNDIVAKLSDN